MQIDVGDYTLECDIDPMVQNNAEGELIPMIVLVSFTTVFLSRRMHSFVL